MVEGHAHASGPQWGHDEWADLVQRLNARRAAFDRYTVHEEVGHGGMGRVLHVRDEDLHRDLAMKVMKQDGSALGTDPSTPTMMRARFVEEAQVAGQLDHPGIVPVHDVGLDADGQFYFTMKLVRGRTFEKVLGLARDGAEGWSLTRVLNTLLRVCEAMSYAHERGVIHRDLKPANVMIGNHGEVYVMDWGLARLVGRADRPDFPQDEEHAAVVSARTSGGSSAGSSLFLTQNDQVVGTPAFMSPEQAAGANAELTAQSDVYSVGAILYMALTGRAPYCQPGKKIENRAVWIALQHGPPKPVAELAPKVAPELVSICEKAMARPLDERYSTMAEFAEDLRAYLEMRVVHAHRTGPIVEFKKWVARNKKSAAGLLVIIAVVSAAGFTVAATERARAREAELRADLGESASLLGEIDDLGPIHPTSLEKYDLWLAQARRLIGTIPVREAEQAGRTRRAESVTPRAPAMQTTLEIDEARDWVTDLEKGLNLAPDQAVAQEIFPEEIRWRRAKLSALEAAVDKDPVLRFSDRKLQTQADQGHQLLHVLHALERTLPLVDGRATLARDLRQRTIEEESDAWKAAVTSIRDPAQCPLYGGLLIEPQVGLVPLRRDSRSGLWEFWHVLSGERPLPDEKGEWIIGPSTGMVLVLVPGGDFRMGAQSADKDEPRFDARAESHEAFRTARLDPYFISKYEMTQGQWLLLNDEEPSYLKVARQFKSTPRTSRSNPVENINWLTCDRVLMRVGLTLPTEMQWERAARGGTELPYLVSENFADIHSTVNIYDRTAAAAMRDKPIEFDDGFAAHVRVDTFGPNGFGLYNVLGNVSEWCRDWYADKDDETQVHEGDGEILVSASSGKKSVRGGSYQDPPSLARVSARKSGSAKVIISDVGLRPARKLDR